MGEFQISDIENRSGERGGARVLQVRGTECLQKTRNPAEANSVMVESVRQGKNLLRLVPQIISPRDDTTLGCPDTPDFGRVVSTYKPQ